MTDETQRSIQSGGGTDPASGAHGLGRRVPRAEQSGDAYTRACNAERDRDAARIGYTRIAYHDHDGYATPYHADATGPYGDTVSDASINPYTATNSDVTDEPADDWPDRDRDANEVNGNGGDRRA